MKTNAPRHETQVAYHRRRHQELLTIRSPWEGVWTGLAEYIEPSRLRLGDAREGKIDRSKIIDSTGTFAHRTLASGMHSGITSPARPWFKLTTPDPDLKDFAPVKDWLAAGKARVLLQASDGSERGKGKLWTPPGGRWFGCLTASELGLSFGRDHVIHSALAPGGLTDRLIRDASRLNGLRGHDGGNAAAGKE